MPISIREYYTYRKAVKVPKGLEHGQAQGQWYVESGLTHSKIHVCPQADCQAGQEGKHPKNGSKEGRQVSQTDGIGRQESTIGQVWNLDQRTEKGGRLEETRSYEAHRKGERPQGGTLTAP